MTDVKILSEDVHFETYVCNAPTCDVSKRNTWKGWVDGRISAQICFDYNADILLEKKKTDFSLSLIYTYLE